MEVEKVFDIYDREILRQEDFETQLAAYLDHLIKKDFEKLVQILYRIDVDEKKLRRLLDQYPETDAGKIMASLIIERQIKKIEFREATKNNNTEWEEC